MGWQFSVTWWLVLSQSDLQLIAKQVCHCPMVSIPSLPAPIDQRIDRAKLVEERGAVHDRHKVVKACNVSKADSRGLIPEGERLLRTVALGRCG